MTIRPRRLRSRHRAVTSIALMAGLLLSATSAATPVHAASRTFYVDCAGNDANSGLSSSLPWRSLTKVNAAALAPGDSVLFKRGCSWTGPLNARWIGTAAAPIVIGAYGSGSLPRIQNAPRDNILVTGSYIVFEYLYTRSNPPSYDAGCQNQPQGSIYGWRFMSGAAYNTVRHSEATGFNIGIWLGPGSHHNKILNNTLPNNNVKDSDPNSDGGAVAVGVHGDDNEIAYNVISGSDACSRQHVRDGAAVDIYGGRYNSIHHNTARENLNFVEVGNSRASDNTLAYNIVSSSLKLGNFAVARGVNDYWGPTYRTRLYNNSVYLTGSESFAVACYGGCGSSVLTFKNNIVWAQDRVGYVDAAWDEGYNVWWSPGTTKIWFTKSSTSKVADPRFVNAAAGDFRLASGSPAINAGTSESVTRGYKVDMAGTSVPVGSAVDIGAYEYGAPATPAPSPTPTATPRPTATPTPAPATTPTPAPGGTVLARDTFSRTATDSWGNATIGGAWAPWAPVADFDVNGSTGTVKVTGANQMRSTFLSGVRVRDLNAVVRVKTDRQPDGTGHFVYLAARNVNPDNEYRANVRFSSTGEVFLHLSRVVAKVETPISNVVSLGKIHAANAFLRVRFQVTGTPANLRAKVWQDGTTEPTGWQASTTDGTSGLQSAGTVGLRSYLSPTSSGSVVYSFDDLEVVAP